MRIGRAEAHLALHWLELGDTPRACGLAQSALSHLSGTDADTGMPAAPAAEHDLGFHAQPLTAYGRCSKAFAHRVLAQTMTQPAVRRRSKALCHAAEAWLVCKEQLGADSSASREMQHALKQLCCAVKRSTNLRRALCKPK